MGRSARRRTVLYERFPSKRMYITGAAALMPAKRGVRGRRVAPGCEEGEADQAEATYGSRRRPEGRKVRRSSCLSLVLSGEKQGYVSPARKSIFPKQLTKHLPDWRKIDILPDSKRQMFAADPALREAICWIVGGCHS